VLVVSIWYSKTKTDLIQRKKTYKKGFCMKEITP